MKAKIKKSKDGLYEIHYPDGTSKWCYTKEDAEFLRDKYNKNK